MLLVTPCLGQVTISFASTGIGTEQDMYIYYINTTAMNTTLVGQYNTTSAYIPLEDPNGSYIFVTKPSTSSELSQPDTAAAAFLAFMTLNWKGMVVFAFFVAGIIILVTWGSGRHKKH